jgi:Arc/MetJ-type ribon-helix-helix transcriptional regulator
MKKASITVSEDLLEDVDARVDAGEFESRSEAFREEYEAAAELRDRVDDLETDVQHAEARVDELEGQLANERDREDDVDELATFASFEKEARRRRERREEARRRAGVVDRLRWWVSGEPADLEERVVDDVQEERAPERADGGRGE